jgi:hypothetical protein
MKGHLQWKVETSLLLTRELDFTKNPEMVDTTTVPEILRSYCRRAEPGLVGYREKLPH